MQETPVQSLGQEDPPEKGMATHSSILAWRIPWTEEPGGPWGCKESDTTNTVSAALSSSRCLFCSYQFSTWLSWDRICVNLIFNSRTKSDSPSLFHRWTIQSLKSRLYYQRSHKVILTDLEFGSTGFPNSEIFFLHIEESLQVFELVTVGTRERPFNSILYNNRKKN